MRRLLASLLLVSLPAAAETPQAAAEPLVPKTTKPRVEIVFALDTTGSMSGLIDGAKRKIWAIASEVQGAQQKPEVKIGLVAYRDRGDAYDTQVVPLTSDLDSVYAKLMQMTADGGGDTPEDVNQALDDAVHKIAWSDGKDVLKMIFLVGDAPPHMDYAQQVKWQTSAQSAVRKNIYINTVQCGMDGDTTATWKEIAHAAEGRYAAIPQDGGVAVAVVTPFDADLAGLARELDNTYLDYGASSFRAEKKAARVTAGMGAAAAPASTAADRAAYKAAAGASAHDDLVALAGEKGGAGKALASVKEEALPDELRGKDKAEQEKILQDTAKKREKLATAITSLQKKREQFLKDEAKKSGKAGDAFDAEVVDMVRAQGAEAGLTY